MKKIFVCLVTMSLCGCYQGEKSPKHDGYDGHEYYLTINYDRVHAWDCEKCHKERKAEMEYIVDSMLKKRKEAEK